MSIMQGEAADDNSFAGGWRPNLARHVWRLAGSGVGNLIDRNAAIHCTRVASEAAIVSRRCTLAYGWEKWRRTSGSAFAIPRRASASLRVKPGFGGHALITPPRRSREEHRREVPQPLGIRWIDRVGRDAAAEVFRPLRDNGSLVAVLEIPSPDALELRRGHQQYRGRGPPARDSSDSLAA